MILIILIRFLIEICELRIRSSVSFCRFKRKFDHGVNEYAKKHQKYDIHIASLAYGCLTINSHLNAIKKIYDVDNMFDQDFIDKIKWSFAYMEGNMSTICSLLSCSDNWLKDNRKAMADNIHKIKRCKILLEAVLEASSSLVKLCDDNGSIFNESRARYRMCIMHNFSRRVEYLVKFCSTHVELILKSRISIGSNVCNQSIYQCSSSIMQENK